MSIVRGSEITKIVDPKSIIIPAPLATYKYAHGVQKAPGRNLIRTIKDIRAQSEMSDEALVQALDNAS